jgi:hypothetical protein
MLDQFLQSDPHEAIEIRSINESPSSRGVQARFWIGTKLGRAETRGDRVKSQDEKFDREASFATIPGA